MTRSGRVIGGAPYPPERFSALGVCHQSHGGLGPVASRAEEYRAKARECEEFASRAADPHVKQQLLDLAKQWQRIAEQADRYDSR